MTIAPLHWRKSSHSTGSGACVELACPPTGTVHVRNSNHADAGTLTLTPAQMATWLAGARAGDLDDLAGS